ncbi:hypothetical protein [Vibrio genomosp. F10]|uniref:hypothetical protein n=1 Tax=Vibrio genomosp. F10 TaxID=723171 RepID=UPI00030C7C25|nr:hypothetical protein [Vibrio genomosp. F10]OEF06033.1 hypothetical protein A1QI_07110 [Vibrio genomosp. F10 str. 9ZB36]
MKKVLLTTLITVLSTVAWAEDPTESRVTGPDNSAINAMAALIGLSGVCEERGLYVTEFMIEALLEHGEQEYGRFLYSEFFSAKVKSWEQSARNQENISNECLNFATQFNAGLNSN